MCITANIRRDLARLSAALSLFNRGDAKSSHEAVQLAGLTDEQAGWGCFRRLSNARAAARGRRISRADLNLADRVLSDYIAANPELAKKI
jgi:hypothetical protein